MIVAFSRPVYLVLLVLIPAIILVYFISLKSKKVRAIKFANFDALARIKGVDILSKNISSIILTILLILCLVFSLSGLTIYRELSASEFSFVIAIDSSKSMEANDFSPTRLEAAKSTARSFVDSLVLGSRVGIISFSGNSFIETPLTDDKIIIKQSVSQIPLSSIGGTDIYEAVLTSSNLLEGEKARAVIVLSDGQLNIGTIDDLIAYANQRNIVVNTIGIGTTAGGETSFGLSKIDEDSLKAIAYNTGGKYFLATTPQEMTSQFNQILDSKFQKVPLDLSQYLVLAALVLVIIEYAIINTRFQSIP